VIELSEPVGERAIVPTTSAETITFDSARLAGRFVEFSFDPTLLAGEAIGDLVMLQSVDDPAVQFQVTGVFGPQISGGMPEPHEMIYAEDVDSGRLLLPRVLVPGDYHVHFPTNPQINGVVTVSE